MIKDEQSRHSLTAGVMLVLLMGPALAAPKRASTVLDWLAAKDDTIFFRSILARCVGAVSLAWRKHGRHAG